MFSLISEWGGLDSDLAAVDNSIVQEVIQLRNSCSPCLVSSLCEWGGLETELAPAPQFSRENTAQ